MTETEEKADKVRAEIKRAVHILSLYGSPFPDAQERHIRQKQITHIRNLEEQLRTMEEKR